MGKVATCAEDTEPTSVPPSDDSDTEWKDEMDDAGACPLGIAMPSLPTGAYVSTLSESDFLRGGMGGRDGLGTLGLRGKEDEEELDADRSDP